MRLRTSRSLAAGAPPPPPPPAGVGPVGLSSCLVLGSYGWGRPYIRCSGQELAPFVHSLQGRALLALPGRDVFIVPGKIKLEQLGTHRSLYVNAILIQSRGTAARTPCSYCRTRGCSPFPECWNVPGHFGGACANCKWPDHAIRCSIDLTAEDEDVQEIPRLPALALPWGAPGTLSNPLPLPDEEGEDEIGLD